MKLLSPDSDERKEWSCKIVKYSQTVAECGSETETTLQPPVMSVGWFLHGF